MVAYASIADRVFGSTGISFLKDKKKPKEERKGKRKEKIKGEKQENRVRYTKLILLDDQI